MVKLVEQSLTEFLPQNAVMQMGSSSNTVLFSASLSVLKLPPLVEYSPEIRML